MFLHAWRLVNRWWHRKCIFSSSGGEDINSYRNMETSKPQGKCLLLYFLVLVYFRPNKCTVASFLFRLHTHLIFYSNSDSEHMHILKVAFSGEIRNCSWMRLSVTGFMSSCIILETCIHWSLCNAILLFNSQLPFSPWVFKDIFFMFG
jgi:hypothetical protein